MYDLLHMLSHLTNSVAIATTEKYTRRAPIGRWFGTSRRSRSLESAMKAEDKPSASASSVSADSVETSRMRVPTEHDRGGTLAPREERARSRPPWKPYPWFLAQIKEFSLPLLILAIKSISFLFC
jgi:hypothetical protein